MKTIFDMQFKLNDYTLRKLGLNYGIVTTDERYISTWIENYRKAFQAEYAELLEDMLKNGKLTANAKIEVVDILHFLVSLSHFVDIDPEEVLMLEKRPGQSTMTELIFIAITKIQNSVKWKWWATGGGFKLELAKEAIEELWALYNYMWRNVFGMTFEELKGLYMKKNEVNYKRQIEGYNEDTKTEADNEAIMAGIRM